MKRIGLTGSIGMGKSTTAAMFQALGVPVFDSDACVHGLTGPGGKALAAIEAAFPGVTGDDGVDRAALGARVFGNSDAKALLESLLHPLVFAAQKHFLVRHRHARRPLAVLDIPLLFETGAQTRMDVIVVVSAPAFLQAQRVLRRPGMTMEKFAAIKAAQMPDKEKCRRADYMVQTGLGRRFAYGQVCHILHRLTA